MKAHSFDLAWIVVNDIKKAIDFYTQVIGLKVMEFHEEYGWAELSGQQGGARLGIAQKQADQEGGCGTAGQNAVVTFTVESLEQAVKSLLEKGAKLIGEIQVVPGHVKLQTVADADGNQMQLVEVLHQAKELHQHEHGHGCCH